MWVCLREFQNWFPCAAAIGCIDGWLAGCLNEWMNGVCSVPKSSEIAMRLPARALIAAVAAQCCFRCKRLSLTAGTQPQTSAALQWTCHCVVVVKRVVATAPQHGSACRKSIFAASAILPHSPATAAYAFFPSSAAAAPAYYLLCFACESPLFFGRFVCVCACLFIAACAARAACSPNFLANFQALKQLLIAFSSYSSQHNSPAFTMEGAHQPPTSPTSYLTMATCSFCWQFAPFEFLKFWQICA